MSALDIKVTFEELAEHLKPFEGEVMMSAAGLALHLVTAVYAACRQAAVSRETAPE